MPRMRSLTFVQPSWQAAEVLEMRTMLSASSKKAPLADSGVQGTVEIQALDYNQSISGQATVTGTLAVGKKLTTSFNINPPGPPLASAIAASFKSKIVSISENGSQRTITLAAPKKALKIPVSVDGRTFTLTVKPKSQPVTLVIDVETKQVISFGISYTLGPIPGLTQGPTDVNVSLFAASQTI